MTDKERTARTIAFRLGIDNSRKTATPGWIYTQLRQRGYRWDKQAACWVIQLDLYNQLWEKKP